MNMEERVAIGKMLLALVPLAVLRVSAEDAGARPETNLDFSLRFSQIQAITDSMRELKIMVYGKNDEKD